MPYVNDFECVNIPKSEDAKEGSATTPPLPPPPSNQPLLIYAPQHAGPSRLHQIGAVAAAFVMGNGGEGVESDSEDSDNSEGSICTYCCVNVPFRIRRASTPAAIGGNSMIDAADDAMDAVLAQRLARAENLLL